MTRQSLREDDTARFELPTDSCGIDYAAWGAPA